MSISLSRALRPLLSISSAFVLSALATPALADLSVCNESGIKTHIAVATKRSDGYLSRGWWSLPPTAVAPR